MGSAHVQELLLQNPLAFQRLQSEIPDNARIATEAKSLVVRAKAALEGSFSEEESEAIYEGEPETD